MRYIGSKARVAGEIGRVLGQCGRHGRFIDGFCGTGSVAAMAADLGWAVVVNDCLESSVAVAAVGLLAASDVPFRTLGGYGRAITLLDELPGEHGFIYREYSPASRRLCGTERRYFTEPNAARIDAVRRRIADWQTNAMVTALEAELLVADLLAATSRVANIAGTYGCFLRHWTANATRPLRLVPRRLRAHAVVFEASCRDVFDLAARADDVIYFDPPYTKRQYAAYYHLLETIAVGDEPIVGGVTGLRPWEHKASSFCYKARALPALADLCAATGASRVLISYSDDGHIAIDALIDRLARLGSVQVHVLGTIGRYRPNEQASANGAAVYEYLIELHKPHPDRQEIGKHEQVAVE